jgi:hypothetical protein
MLLGAAGRNARLKPLQLAAISAPATDAALGGADALVGESAQYLSREVRYDGDRLLDEADDAVMMAWESPLMHAHAQLLCGDGKDRRVLNIGFGMAIIDGYIQEAGCKAHCIIEAHPIVAARARRDGWDARATLVEGRWQDALAPGGSARAHGPWDAIFYDAYAEDYADMRELHAMLPELLVAGGVYSFFNGLCPDNIFFHGVVCQVVQVSPPAAARARASGRSFVRGRKGAVQSMRADSRAFRLCVHRPAQLTVVRPAARLHRLARSIPALLSSSWQTLALRASSFRCRSRWQRTNGKESRVSIGTTAKLTTYPSPPFRLGMRADSPAPDDASGERGRRRPWSRRYRPSMNTEPVRLR